MFEVRKLYESYDMNDPKKARDFYNETAEKIMMRGYHRRNCQSFIGIC